MQVTAATAQRKRLAADKKMQENVNKRGLVPNNAVERRQGKLSVGPIQLSVSTASRTRRAFHFQGDQATGLETAATAHRTHLLAPVPS